MQLPPSGRYPGWHEPLRLASGHRHHHEHDDKLVSNAVAFHVFNKEREERKRRPIVQGKVLELNIDKLKDLADYVLKKAAEK